MATLLGGGIAQMLGSALGLLLTTGTLERQSGAGVNSFGDPTPSSFASFAFRGFIDEKSETITDPAGVVRSRTKVNITSVSIATVPLVGDRLVIGGATYTVSAVSTDPARALWVCEVFL